MTLGFRQTRTESTMAMWRSVLLLLWRVRPRLPGGCVCTGGGCKLDFRFSLLYARQQTFPESQLLEAWPLAIYACHMPDVMFVIYVKYGIYDIFDMYGALTYTICMYVNMGVKRSVRTSGMQPTILNIL